MFGKLFLVILCVFVSEATKAQLGSGSNSSKLYLTDGMFDSTISNFAKANGVGLVHLIGQADIDPHNDMVLDVGLLKKKILSVFPDSISSGIAVLDWEGKAANVLRTQNSSKHFEQVMDEFIKTIRFAKALRPHVQWGFFGLPFGDFFYMNANWINRNQKLSPILSQCDIIFPAVYISYSDDQVGANSNLTFINKNVTLALEIGDEIQRPVMPFIWHRFKNFQQIPANTFYNYVRSILSVTYKGRGIDGLVWWGVPFYFYRTKMLPFSKQPSYSVFSNQHDTFVMKSCQSFLNDIHARSK